MGIKGAVIFISILVYLFANGLAVGIYFIHSDLKKELKKINKKLNVGASEDSKQKESQLENCDSDNEDHGDLLD